VRQKNIFFLIVILLFALDAVAQQRPSRPIQRMDGNVRPQGSGPGGGMMPGQNPFGNQEQEGEGNAPKKAGDPNKILDDSTKSIYGPKTTKYLLEKDIKFNRSEYKEPDTLINNIHNYSPTDRSGNLFQDLGTMGTAMRPYYYVAPENIGLTSGFHSYDPYWLSPDRIKYFDTKSPYTDLRHVIGGGERSFTDITFARNVTPLWNVGVDFRRINADHQYGAGIRRGDRHPESTNYAFFTRFRSKNEKYQLLANFSRLNQKVNENGGINPVSNFGPVDPFDKESAFLLRSSRSQDFRYNFHTYQQYSLKKALEFYHSADYYSQKNRFISVLERDSINFESPIFSKDTTKDETLFRAFTNEIGVKGSLQNLFYNVYAKRRDISYSNAVRDPRRGDIWENQVLKVGQNFAENYGGFNLRYELGGQKSVEGFGEYLLGGNYRIGANLNSRYFNAKASRVKYAPSLLAQSYLSNHRFWENDFGSITSENIHLNIPLRLSFLELRPHVTLSRISNFIYFNEDRMPVQSKDGLGNAALLFNPGADLKLTFFKKIHWENNFIYTHKIGDGADAFRIPEIFAVSRLYYSNFLFKSNLQLSAGVETFYRSSFKGLGFDPVIQQFHIQNDMMVDAYPVVDLFVNLKISRARIFAKFVHVNQGNPADGYFATPMYPGQRRVFDFGFSWLFFD
jgi:hypothetical protein